MKPPAACARILVSTDTNYFDPKQAADEDQNVLMCRVRDAFPDDWG